MSTALNEMQFELLPSLNAPAGAVFGIGSQVSIDDEGFDPGEDSWESETETNPRRGGVTFGRDLLAGPVWGFDLHINRVDLPGAVESLETFKTAWRARHIRDTPNRVIPLRYRLNDRYRRVYGRPGRFAAPPSNRLLSGFVPITADFACVDSNTYDDIEQVETLALSAGTGGGFKYPVVYPISTTPPANSLGQAVVGGTADTYPTIRFNGPVINPVLTTDAWTLALNMTIGAGSYVDVDLRPWAISAMLNGTSGVGGAIGRRTYLSEMKFSPGNHPLIYRGSSESSSSTCEVRWSNAYNSI